MIKELSTTRPFIDFGLGITATSTIAGTPVTVWLSTLYNSDAYTTGLNAPGGVVTRVTDYEYSVTYSAAGEHHISLFVNSTTRKTSLQSNTITLTVK